MADVELARKQLLIALGEYGERYWNNMKLWYKQKITKDDFDTQAFQLLGPGKIHLHNEFLLAILARCHALIAAPASIPSKVSQKSSTKSALLRKPKVKRPGQHTYVRLQHQFEKVDAVNHADAVIPKIYETYLMLNSPYECDNNYTTVNVNCKLPLRIRTSPAITTFKMKLKEFLPHYHPSRSTSSRKTKPTEDFDAKLCTVEMALPDVPTLHGRLYLGAWEQGLSSVADDSALLISRAVEAHLKNILTACVARRKPYKLRDNQFKNSFGTDSLCVKEMSTESSGETTHNTEEAEATAMLMLSSNKHRLDTLAPISTFDLRDTIQLNKTVIPSYTVRATNMERILSDLWHPGHEEIEQSQLYKLETKRFSDILRQQRGLRA